MPTIPATTDAPASTKATHESNGAGTPAVTKKPKKKGSKPAAKAGKKAAKKKAAKPATKRARGEGDGIERDHDLPWNEKKASLFRTLKNLGATSKTDARGANELVEKSGGTLSDRDVRHYGYAARAAGLIEVAEGIEGIRGYGFYLTAKGQKVDVAAELKAKEAKKS